MVRQFALEGCLRLGPSRLAGGLRARPAWKACAALVLSLAVFGTSIVEAAANCRPKRRLPPVVLKTMEPCAFDPAAVSFAGTPQEQAMCLLRSFDRGRNLAPMLESLPQGIAARVGQSAGLPTRERLATYLSRRDLEWDFAASLWQPVSRGSDNAPDAPTARYMVFHDTSGPNYGGRPWPANLDEHARLNNLRRFVCADGWAIAHVVINRQGRMFRGHDFSVPWRATKFERATNFAGALKGLFLHVELIQPRKRAPGRGRYNDALAPTPGFSAAQYNSLALVYTIASVRAGQWLIPAFHAPIDARIRGGHDDPQNFELDTFADSLERLNEVLLKPPPEPAAQQAQQEERATSVATTQ
jgi:hypothetical protein